MSNTLSDCEVLDDYGGCSFALLADGTFRTATCCDSDHVTARTMRDLRDWLIAAFETREVQDRLAVELAEANLRELR